jgi:phospholipid/cholesterol/gamma-HCH transport system substrate-binding protein
MTRLAKLLTSVITLLCLVGVGLVAYIQTQNGDESYKVTAYFDKAIGLFPNSDVTILGVPVGKITAVDPVGERVRVDMEIDSQYKVPADAFAEIVPISVISDRYVEFSPVYRGGPALQDGASLGTDRTQIPAELDDVFKQLKKLFDALAPTQDSELGSLGELIVALNKALEGREQDLKGTLIEGADLTQTIALAEEDISGLLINLDSLFATLAPRADSIATLNRNFATVMKFLSDSRSDLEGTLVNLAAMTRELSTLVKNNGSRLAGILGKAARITPTVLKNQESIQESLAWLPVAGEALANAYHGGEINATDIRSDRVTAALCEDLDDLPIDPGEFPDPLRDLIGRRWRTRSAQSPGPGSEPDRGPRRGGAPAPAQLRSGRKEGEAPDSAHRGDRRARRRQGRDPETPGSGAPGAQGTVPEAG